jgi:hypothetical protein
MSAAEPLRVLGRKDRNGTVETAVETAQAKVASAADALEAIRRRQGVAKAALEAAEDRRRAVAVSTALNPDNSGALAERTRARDDAAQLVEDLTLAVDQAEQDLNAARAALDDAFNEAEGDEVHALMRELDEVSQRYAQTMTAARELSARRDALRKIVNHPHSVRQERAYGPRGGVGLDASLIKQAVMADRR